MAFEQLKERQSVMWGNGDYEAVADSISDAHDVLVERLAPQEGERWLDLACGTGAVAERAAEAGASVVGIDFAPALVDVAKRRASERGFEIEYRIGDCEDLADVGDASFGVVSSSFGIMFCPDHAAVAHELGRVLPPGGRLGLVSWVPDGGIGRMFGMMAPFQPSPPPGADAPLDWGRRAYVEELLGGAFELEFDEGISTARIASGEEYWQLFSTNFGPAKTLAESLDDETREEFHRAWVDFFETGYRVGDEIVHPREYLLVIGTRR